MVFIIGGFNCLIGTKIVFVFLDGTLDDENLGTQLITDAKLLVF